MDILITKILEKGDSKKVLFHNYRVINFQRSFIECITVCLYEKNSLLLQYTVYMYCNINKSTFFCRNLSLANPYMKTELLLDVILY